MGGGFSVVVGMSLAYAVSFFGLMLAYIVWQRNNSKDEMWRRRPVGVSFFGAFYGFIIPAIIVINVLLTLLIKIFRGWDFNSFIWSTDTLAWSIPLAVALYWLVGGRFWKLRWSGYLASLTVTAAATVWMIVLLLSGGGLDLHRIGAFVTGLLWHGLWTVYFLRHEVRKLFSAAQAPPATHPGSSPM